MSLLPRPGHRPLLLLLAAGSAVFVPAFSHPARALPAGGTAHAAPPPVVLAPHSAAYDLSLASTTDGDTVAASGDMRFAVTDSCGGWATQQSLHLQVTTREGQSSDMVSTYATLESKDGRHLTFDMQERDNGALTQQVRGEASLDASGVGTVHYTLPAASTITLPRGTLFPMAHTAAIIAAAEAGEKSIDPILFDGTSADGPSDSYVTILPWHAAPSDSDQAALRPLGSGRVHVSFFNRKPSAITPDYEVGMRYFANGVSDRLRMDFGAFAMNGVMRSFTPGQSAGRCHS